jgi:hypothetical protein
MVMIENVPHMMWGIDKEVTFVQAAECVLRHMGLEYDYDELLCASGIAFSLKWNKTEPCPSAGTIEDPLYIARMFKYVGFTVNAVRPGEPDFSETIETSLGNGIPVIVQGGFNIPEFYVLAGYDPSGPRYYGRTPFDRSDDYVVTKTNPVIALAIGEEIADRPEGLARLYYPLHSAMLAYNRKPDSESWEGNYEHSFEAFDMWVKHLSMPELWLVEDPETTENYVVANEYVFDILYTSRLAAARYLLRTANFHNIADAEKIMYAARLYYVIAKVLHQRGFTAFGAGHPVEGYAAEYLSDQKNRLEWAHFIRDAAEKDRQASELIRAVVNPS